MEINKDNSQENGSEVKNAPKEVTSLEMFQNPLFYDAVYGNPERGQIKYSKEIENINKFVIDKNLEKRVLDVGCGTGIHLSQLAKLGFEGHGLDINPKMLEFAKSKSVKESINFTLGDMRSFDLNKQFPLITCMYGAFNYLPDEEGVTQSLNCFLKHLDNNGYLIIDSRWAKHQPKKVDFEERSDGISIVKQWTMKEGSARDAIYKVAFIKPGENGILIYEDHSQNFCDPFYLKEKMQDVGFTNIKIIDNFDFSKEVSSQDKVWRTVIVAQK